MNNYLNGKIYKLIDNTNGNIYIGSTIKTLNRRLKNHKNEYKSYLNEKSKFITSFEIIKNGDYKIELIELYPCENKRELIDREGFYIKNIDCINKHIMGRTRKEYWKEYHDLNKDLLLEKYKRYYRENIDKISEKDKRYYRENIDKIKDRKSKTFECICGSISRIHNRKKHFKTIKHINFMDSITD